MKRSKLLTGCLVALSMALSSPLFAADLAGVPIKHKSETVANCVACHEMAVPTTKPASEKCISCHGPMKNIKVAENPQGKNPHASDHYGDTIECTACHAEHKPSKAVCNNCHKVDWHKFK